MPFFSVSWRRVTWTGWGLLQPGDYKGGNCVWTLCGWDLDGRLEADTGRKVFPGETHYYHILGPQYPKPMVLFCS